MKKFIILLMLYNQLPTLAGNCCSNRASDTYEAISNQDQTPQSTPPLVPAKIIRENQEENLTNLPVAIPIRIAHAEINNQLSSNSYQHDSQTSHNPLSQIQTVYNIYQGPSNSIIIIATQRIQNNNHRYRESYPSYPQL